ncbi:hypothetical protein [Bacillus sp. mrc49]|uniref:hypothetical protein n=1 Tax=Bacillus sp. mrc49 TaxID=2054913 RepID=UPI000C2762C5|nr:hypothetical protein [Bacillus sp. mrc49]PJN90461.1 hypothetical protein CVN76_10180 [Bacillus sp. mrc49]
MLVRLYVNAKDEDELKVNITPFIEKFATIVKKITWLETKKYWKFEGVFEVLYEFKLQDLVTYSAFHAVLQSVSDHWLELGTGKDKSLLASKNAEECQFILGNMELVTLTQLSDLL